MMRVVLLFVGLLLASACDDKPFGPDTPPTPTREIPTNPTACDIATQITELRCTQCHNDGGTQPSLTLTGLQSIVGAASINYAGKTLVVAGDAEASLLYRKVHGPAADEGGKMPIGGSLEDVEMAAIASWINGGAITDCTSDGEGEGDEGEGEGNEGEGEAGVIPTNPTACDVAGFVTEARCTQCHNAGGTPPLLTLAGAPSPGYPGQTLIVAGDAASSLLFRKIDGPGAAEGSRMPLGGTLSAEQIAAVAAWIDGGAETSCTPLVGEGEGEGAGEGEGEVEIPANPTACDVAAYITEARCTQCHNAGGTPPLLTLAGLEAAIGAPSPGYAGQTLIVAGDAAASLLFRKVDGPGASEGSRMPLGGAALSAAQIDALAAWIDGGAETSCTPIIVDPPVGIEPGGPINVGAPPSGFASSPPAFAAGENCSTGQWWQSAGDENESFSMHPGRACISCHTDNGDPDAPSFSYAGTVMGDLRDEDDCRGVPGVTVAILDGSDRVIGTAVTNAAGNFGLCSEQPEDVSCQLLQQASSWRIRLSYDGRTRDMAGHQSTIGDCASCHTAAGRNGAPGRVVAP
jgi:mono/diheme cytochrome c family protein